MNSTTHRWSAGQRVQRGASEIVTIDRVTPTGIACIGPHQYDAKRGTYRGERSGRWYSPDYQHSLRELTPEREAEILEAKGYADAKQQARDVVDETQRLLRFETLSIEQLHAIVAALKPINAPESDA